MGHLPEAKLITLIHKAAKASTKLLQKTLRHFGYIDREISKGKVEMDKSLLQIEFSVASDSEDNMNYISLFSCSLLKFIILLQKNH